MKKFLFTALTALAVVLAGCSSYDDTAIKNDIADLQERVATLEQTTASLSAQLSAGSLIKSVTPLADNSGWKIEFTNGDSRAVSSIEVMHGNHGVTPLIEVRRNPDGTTTLWHNCTEGYPESGWVDTEADLVGDAIGDSPLRAITDNQAEGTVTFTMNDGNDPHETFVFGKASSAVRFEILTTEALILEKRTGTITFRVNPSNAWIPTGTGEQIEKWALDQVSTRSSYVTDPTDFSLVSILPDEDEEGNVKTGQYIATIQCEAYDAAINAYSMALVLDTTGGENPALVSTSPFVLTAKKVFQPTAWDQINDLMLNEMQDGDILDLSEIESPEDPFILNVWKDITITNRMDPVAGPQGTLQEPHHNVQIWLQPFDPLSQSWDPPTVMLEDFAANGSGDENYAIVNGTGDLILQDCQLENDALYSVIEVQGEVRIYGTVAKLFDGNISYTSHINGNGCDNAINAECVLVDGALIEAGDSENSGGTAIYCSGYVDIYGGFVEINGELYDRTKIVGGSGKDGDGGDAINAEGYVFVLGGIIRGGNGNNGNGGRGIVSNEDIILAGERVFDEAAGEWRWSCHVASGWGDTIGIPAYLTGYDRGLWANTVKIESPAPNAEWAAASCMIRLTTVGLASLDDCAIGSDPDGYIFPDDCYYQITNPFQTIGKLDNAISTL